MKSFIFPQWFLFTSIPFIQYHEKTKLIYWYYVIRGIVYIPCPFLAHSSRLVTEINWRFSYDVSFNNESRLGDCLVDCTNCCYWICKLIPVSLVAESITYSFCLACSWILLTSNMAQLFGKHLSSTRRSSMYLIALFNAPVDWYVAVAADAFSSACTA